MLRKKWFIKFDNNLNEIELTANPTTWTEMYSFDYSTRECFIMEICINSNNNHLLKIEIDDESIIEINVNDLYDKFEDTEKIMNGLKIEKDGGNYILNLELDETNYCNSLKIYQKRRDNKTRNLSLNGILIKYKERIVYE